MSTKKVLIINAHQKYEGFAEGGLTKSYIQKADEFFNNEGFNVEHTTIEEGYDAQKEQEKLLNADIFSFQYPVYWMSMPWIAKNNIDEVFTPSQGTLYTMTVEVERMQQKDMEVVV